MSTDTAAGRLADRARFWGFEVSRPQDCTPTIRVPAAYLTLAEAIDFAETLARTARTLKESQ